jgi:hypothetical protein
MGDRPDSRRLDGRGSPRGGQDVLSGAVGLRQGKPTVISAPCSVDLKRIVERLVERAEALRTGQVDPRQDNMLLVTTDGRKAALDLRLYDPEFLDQPGSKVNRAVTEIRRLWHETAATRSTQLVFCDLSTPTGGRGFSVYEDMRDKLVRLGVPPGEIAFIQDYDTDAAKFTLFRDVRAGHVRILFGSTAKMGTGANVQERLIALHHLDAPWRPADVEQREGRILRQGNTHPEVQIFRYVTEESFDAYMWQTLETKARFIAQVMTGQSELRRIEDIDGTALTYAEVKAIASGNPIVIVKANIDAELARLGRLRTQHAEAQFRFRTQIRHLTEEIPRLEKRREDVQCDLVTRHDTRGELFTIQLDGQEIKDRGIAGELLLRHAERMRGTRGERLVGRFAGFQVFVADNFMGGPEILLKGAATHPAKVGTSALGTIRSVEYAVQNLDEVTAGIEQRIVEARQRITALAEQLAQPFEHEDRLAELRVRQAEIDESLDLTKDQGSSRLDGEAAEGEAPDRADDNDEAADSSDDR